jgi:hypothetical protein
MSAHNARLRPTSAKRFCKDATESNDVPVATSRGSQLPASPKKMAASAPSRMPPSFANGKDEGYFLSAFTILLLSLDLLCRRHTAGIAAKRYSPEHLRDGKPDGQTNSYRKLQAAGGTGFCCFHSIETIAPANPPNRLARNFERTPQKQPAINAMPYAFPQVFGPFCIGIFTYLLFSMAMQTAFLAVRRIVAPKAAFAPPRFFRPRPGI